VRRALVAVALSACVLWSARCADQPAPVASSQDHVTTWHALGTWSGRGHRQTESFDVTTGTLRLTWETRGEGRGGPGRFRVTLNSAISGRPLQTIVERTDAGHGMSYVADDPRVSYLVIEAEQMEWRVSLDEAMPAVKGQ
jgi:hypothetical protein